MKNPLWRFWYFINGFWEGDLQWGRVRLGVFIAAAFLYMALGRFIFETVDVTVMATDWRTKIFLFRLLRIPLPFLEIFAHFLNWSAARYWLMPIAAVGFALWWGSRYVQDIYELKNFKPAFNYLMATLFARNYPHLEVAAGSKQIKPGEINLLDAIGGPGYISVQPGSIVLFERLREPASVRAAGVHFVPRREKLNDEIGSLDDQPGEVKEVTATSKDGILVTVSNITYRYRLRASSQKDAYVRRKSSNPYPFSIQAMRNMAYRRAVGGDGKLTPWPMAVEGVIKGAITGYVSSHQVDYLTAPKRHDKDPRLEIVNQLKSKGTREGLKNVGAELLWCDIGHFGLPDSVDAQRDETWSAKWQGSATVVEAYGKAQRVAYRDLARGEAQAEMLISIFHALEDVDLSSDHADNLRQMILARTAGVLESMTEIGRIPLVEDTKKSQPGA